MIELFRRKEIVQSLVILLLIIGISTETSQIQGISHVKIHSSVSNFTTYLGGNDTEDKAKITFDSEGNVIVFGQTGSADFPTTPDCFQDTRGNLVNIWQEEYDTFITKFDTTGNLVFSTYLGGEGPEVPRCVTIDNLGNIVVVGSTDAPQFPVSDDAYLSNRPGYTDTGFIAKFNQSGELIYSTFFGGLEFDQIIAVEFDEENNYIFAGHSQSDDLATTGVYQEHRAGNVDCFVARLSEDGQTLQMLTYFGGSNRDILHAMTLDNNDNYIITGLTYSDDLPLTDDAFQNESSEGSDVFVAAIDYDGQILNYSSYLGECFTDVRNTLLPTSSSLSVHSDSQGGIIISGVTESDEFPTTDGAYQQDPKGGRDCFIARFSETRELDFCTRLGGNKTDELCEIYLDAEGNVLVVGSTTSYDFPTVNAPQSSKNQAADAFVLRMSSDGSSLLDSTYIGGNGSDFGEGIAVDSEGNIVISGSTASDDFPVTAGAYQEERAGYREAFVSIIDFTPEDTTTSTTTITTTTSTTGPDGGVDWLLVTAGLGAAAVVILIVIIVKIKK